MSSARRPSRRSICARISLVHGSAPNTPARRLVGSAPAVRIASPRKIAYEGVQVRMSGRRSSIMRICRSVIPPDSGNTVAPSRMPPWWTPRPPVNSP